MSHRQPAILTQTEAEAEEARKAFAVGAEALPGGILTPAEAMALRCASASKSRGRPLAAKTLAIREAIASLTEQYDVMTVRQVFYQLVARGIVPKDEDQGYRPVQTQVLKMRREGLLPWEFIADETRWQRKPLSFDSADDALRTVARTYRRNLWRAQGARVEVWLEKDALAGVVMEATDPWDVALMVSRGTSSATFLYSAAQEIRRAWQAGILTYVFALYDRDAAGLRCARAVERGLREHAGVLASVIRLLAVTDEQVEKWNLPTRPAKASDPEAAKFSGPAVELDAIPPDKLIALVSEAIVDIIDPDAWQREQAVELEERSLLERIAVGEAGA